MITGVIQVIIDYRCNTGYAGTYCSIKLNFVQNDYSLSTDTVSWIRGRYVWYQSQVDNSGIIFYMHESGQAYLKLTNVNTWQLIQYVNKATESTTVLYTGTVSTDYGAFTTATFTTTDTGLPTTLTWTLSRK